jgi:Fe-S-cluster containining protein
VAELSIDWNQPTPEAAPAKRVVLPEPMLRYACNQQGCCCQGWRIPFRPRDLVRLGRYLPREELTREPDVRTGISESGEAELRDVSFLDEAGHCRFLESDHKRCSVHAQHGVEALPDICVDFPVVSYASVEGADFFFDPVCPSVLDQLGESNAPLELAQLDSPYADGGHARRASHLRPRPAIRLGSVEIEPAEFDRIRRLIVEALRDQSRSAVEHLHAIDAAYAGVAAGGAFALRYDRDLKPYVRFFRQATAEHSAGTLERVFEEYRRFLFAIPVDPRRAKWHELGGHLRAWETSLERWYTPQEEAVRPLLLRYLAHRHVTPFLTIQGELHFAAGTVAHLTATALRYAAAFAAVLRRPVDVAILKAALGTSEYVHRSLEIAPASLPWFGISD